MPARDDADTLKMGPIGINEVPSLDLADQSPCAGLWRDLRRDNMKKVLSAFLAVATIAGSLATAMPTAQADGGRIAAGVGLGILGGAIAGAAIANSRPAYGYGYAPGPVYVEEPACRLVRERFWDGYGWRVRRVQVCD